MLAPAGPDAGLREIVGAESVRTALTTATRELAAAGCDTPRLDADVLLAEVLSVDRAELYAGLDRDLERDDRGRFATVVARRAAREPVAYIVGRRGFRHIEVRVDRRVLIPRPDTELLVEAALELPHAARVVDVGTGSGAVALAVKHERPDLHVTATDVDPDALDVARDNARRLGLDVHLRRADLLAGLDGCFDAVLANLPYVPAAEVEALMPEIADHEPRAALAGGADGLALLRRLCDQLRGTSVAALEAGAGQAAAVVEMLAAAGFIEVEVRRDLAGIDRVVLGRRT